MAFARRLLMAALLGSMAGCGGGGTGTASAPLPGGDDDPLLWLEEIEGERAMDWVKARNAESEKALEADPAYAGIEKGLLEILESKERIPSVVKRGPWYYNFWTDERNPRGLWRRTTPESYRTKEPAWEVLLDVDALGKAEGESWVFGGAQLLKPGYDRALVSLSRGGSDADVLREFDLATKRFVDDGFVLPESKGNAAWVDRDTLFVARDFGPGSLTTSGYPRVAKVWKRGTPLADAPVVYEGKPDDLAVSAWHDDTTGFERDFVNRAIGFFDAELFLRGADGTLRKIDVPTDATAQVHREWLAVSPRTDWTVGGTTWPAGGLMAIPLDAFLAGSRAFVPLFVPTPSSSLSTWSWTRNRLVLEILEDVRCRLEVLTPGAGEWAREPFPFAPRFSTLSFQAIDDEEGDDYFLTITDYLTPTSQYFGTLGTAPVKLRQLPAFFDASGLEIAQHFAVSKDGTRVPYFQVSRAGMSLDGSHATLLYGYGGFESSEVPFYSGGFGRSWLAAGGVWVVANIRGGGEYGPRWHQAALKANRPRSYEDFAAVAEDLARRGVSRPERIGAMGGSNGGLLVGNMITMYPHLFGAVVCEVPLLDMKRYSKLLAGASWMAEYGDPDLPEDWAFLRGFSPYHNLAEGTKYPPVLFTTSTRDDRVHPGHARKMAAKMLGMGADVLYWENIEGGHGGAADHKQAARMWALSFTFLRQRLMGGHAGR